MESVHVAWKLIKTNLAQYLPGTIIHTKDEGLEGEGYFFKLWEKYIITWQ